MTYPPPGDYPPAGGGYPPSGDYPASGGYPPAGGYPPQGGYPPPPASGGGGYPPPPASGGGTPGGYPPPASGGGTPGRPVTVTAAVGLMLAIVFVQFVSTALSVVVIPDALDKMSSASGVDVSGIAKYTMVGTQAIYIVAIVAFVVIALMNLRGRSWARITTFVLCGLAVVCCTCGGISNLGGGSFTSSAGTSAMSVYPGWYTVVAGLLSTVNVLLAGAVIILLALKQSGAYYTAMSGRPGPQQPAAPPYPGY